MNRKDFLKTSFYLGAGLSFIGCLEEKTQTGTIPTLAAFKNLKA